MRVAANVKVLCAVGDFGNGTFNLPPKLDSSSNAQLTTSAPIAQNTCYGLPFQDNALGGLCKTHINKMVENQNFGQAIEALKQGKRVARQGWNGKGMFLFLLPAGTVPTKAIHDPALREVIEQEIGGETFEALGSIRMFTADKKILTGWLASQTDILSEDWVIL